MKTVALSRDDQTMGIPIPTNFIPIPMVISGLVRPEEEKSGDWREDVDEQMLHRVRVIGSQRKRRRVRVVLFVDISVKQTLAWGSFWD